MAASPLRKFYTKLNRSKEQLAKGNLQASLINLSEAINIKLNQQFLKRDLTMMGEDLLIFGQRLTNHRLYKEQFGPVALVEGREEEWLGFINQLVSLEEEGTLARLTQGQEHLDKNEFDQARKIFNEVMDDNPDDAGLALEVGDRYMDKGLWTDAEAAYRRAMAIDPNTLLVLNRLAMSLRQDGRLDQALEIYKKALKLNPDDEGLYYNAARVVFQKQRPDIAMKLLKTALEKNPNFEAGQKFLQHLQDRAEGEPELPSEPD